MRLILALTALAASSTFAATIPLNTRAPAAMGFWSAKIDLPLSPLSGALLPDGSMVLWSGKTPGGWASVIGGTSTNYVVVSLDQLRARNPAINLQVSQNPEMFCPGITMLIDGRVLVNGGSGPDATIIFNPQTKKFSQGGLMNIPRGYNSNAYTTGEKVYTVGGSFVRSYTNPRTNQRFGVGGKDGELWTDNAKGGTWAITTPGSGNIVGGIEKAGIPNPDPEGIYRSDNHAWLFPYKAASGDDMLFHAGPVTQMHSINTSKGSITSVGSRGTDSYAMNGNAVQYSPGKVVKFGGAPYYGNSNSSVGMPASSAVYTIDFSKLPKGYFPEVKAAGNMNFRRTFGHAIALPGGKVLVTGGQSAIHLFKDQTGVLTPEIFDPATGKFTKAADMSTARNYHSIALLMRDGTVLLAGGGAAQVACATPGKKPCTPDTHFDAEIYTPPNLATGAARPTISSVNTGLTATHGPRLKLGSTMSVKSTGCGTSGCSYELIRLAAATHSVNNDQLRVPLQVAKRDSAKGDTVNFFAGDMPFVVSGYYYLFAIAANGTPSVASIVQVTRT